MVEKRGRYGRKNGKGFYDYPQSGPKRLWPGLAELQKTKLDPDTIDVDELKQRLLAIQALETARCFEEGVLTDVREADVGSILGFGYAPYSGGTLSYIDMMGTKKFVALCERLAKKYGERFKPNKLLRRDGGQGRELLSRASRRSGRSRRRSAALRLSAEAVCRGGLDADNVSVAGARCWRSGVGGAGLRAGRARPASVFALGADRASDACRGGEAGPSRSKRPRTDRSRSRSIPPSSSARPSITTTWPATASRISRT